MNMNRNVCNRLTVCGNAFNKHVMGGCIDMCASLHAIETSFSKNMGGRENGRLV